MQIFTHFESCESYRKPFKWKTSMNRFVSVKSSDDDHWTSINIRHRDPLKLTCTLIVGTVTFNLFICFLIYKVSFWMDTFKTQIPQHLNHNLSKVAGIILLIYFLCLGCFVSMVFEFCIHHLAFPFTLHQIRGVCVRSMSELTTWQVWLLKSKKLMFLNEQDFPSFSSRKHIWVR